MSNPLFPNIEQVLNILLGELPKNVFSQDRADSDNVDKRSYSSSELRSHAQLLANIYKNLQDVYLDKTISTVQPDGLSSWEMDLFSSAQNGARSFTDRQINLISKYRAQGGISYSYIYNIVHNLLNPKGLGFDLITYTGIGGSRSAAWRLGLSALGANTYLAEADPLIGAVIGNPTNCTNSTSTLTTDQLRKIRETAYTYAVWIYGGADASTLSTLDAMLTQAEPGGSTHVIVNNAVQPT